MHVVQGLSGCLCGSEAECVDANCAQRRLRTLRALLLGDSLARLRPVRDHVARAWLSCSRQGVCGSLPASP